MPRVGILAGLLQVFVALLLPVDGIAQDVVLTNGDTTMIIDPDTGYGIYSLESGAINHLYQHWFWYRIGASSPEIPMTSAAMTLLSRTNTSPSSCRLVFGSTNFESHMTISLNDNPSGPNTVGGAITMAITNTNTVVSLDFHLFAYTDFDLNGTVENAWLRIDNDGAVQAIAGTVSREVLAPQANAYAVGIYPDLVDNLNDGSPTNLNNSSAMGPADNTYAHQWNFLLAPGGVFNVSIAMDVTPKTNFAITACAQTGSSVRLTWESNPMEYYTVQSTTNIMATNWATLGSMTSIVGEIGDMSVVVNTNPPAIYFRVKSSTTP